MLCLDISLDLNLTTAELVLLGYAGLLHDLGKSRIPHQVLAKKSPLDRHEKEMMREHPRLGFLALLDPQYAAITSVIVAHHEFKRDPYPRQGKERRRNQRASAERRAPSALMSNLAPIVAIADMYDALASPRSYKPRFPLKHITETLAAQFTGPSSYIDSIVQRHA